MDDQSMQMTTRDTINLTEKQRRFVEAYMGEACGNATEAARRAGHSGNDETLRQVGSENLTKPHVRAAIEARIEEMPEVAKRQERQQFWTDIMRDNGMDMRFRLKASELLGRAQGDFIDHIEMRGGLSKVEQITDHELVAIIRSTESHLVAG